jgi:hypothetical protein
MAVTSLLTTATFDGDGSNKDFTLPFGFMSAADLSVTVSGVAVLFAVTGAGGSSGGVVTLAAAPPVGTGNVLVRRITALTQPATLDPAGPFRPTTVEGALDRTEMQIQDEVRNRGEAIAAEAAARAAADALIIASGAQPANVGLAPVIATGTTTLRTVADHLGDVFRPEQFGAVGDGTTDDTAAVQAALDAAGAAGGVLELKARYLVSDALTLTSKVRFDIRGPGKITQETADTPIFVFDSCVDWSISGVHLAGVGTDYVGGTDMWTGAPGPSAIYAVDCGRFTIEKNNLENFGYAGVRLKACSVFSVLDNWIEGTHAKGTPITAGDVYQFGILLQWDLDEVGCTDFVVRGNTIFNVAIGLRIEPSARKMVVAGNVFRDIRGQHAIYSNPQDAVFTGNLVDGVSATVGVGIKCQSFYLAGTEWAVKNVSITGNVTRDVLSGITIEADEDAAPDSENVTITGNVCVQRTGLTTGFGVYAGDTVGVVVADNVISGFRYGVFLGVITAGNGCSGIVRGNRISDTQYAGIYAYSLGRLSVSGNQIVRPCLAGVVAEEARTAVYAAAAATTSRVEVSGNTLEIDTSTGVVYGMGVVNCDLWDGGNDWDGKVRHLNAPVVQTKVSVTCDFSGETAWTGIGAIADKEDATKQITVTGAVNADVIAYCNMSSDLQGCSISASMTAGNTMTVTISNATGVAKTIADGTVRWAVKKTG